MNSEILAHWQSALQTHFGIIATLRQLDGEYDLNFMATTNGANPDFVLKVMRPNCSIGLVDMQCKALAHVQSKAPELALPAVIHTKNRKLFAEIADQTGMPRLVWLLEKLPGQTYAAVTPKTLALARDLGRLLGKLNVALADFKHPILARNFKWNLHSSDWIGDHLNAIQDTDRRALVSNILATFKNAKPSLNALPKTPIHNDANDYNILARATLNQPPHITGLIDLGDMTASPRICELAIAGAYLVLDHPTPERALCAMVEAYHAVSPLTSSETDLLWPLLEMRLAVSVVNSTIEAANNPKDSYITISQAPAWKFLETSSINAGLIRARLRAACGFPVVPNGDDVTAFFNAERGKFAPLLDMDLGNAPLGPLSVAASTCPENPFDLPKSEAATAGSEYENNGKPWLGLWGEPRLIYTADAFRQGPWKSSDRRTVHLAVDVFAPAKTKMHAPLEGTIEVLENRDAHLDYGGVIILRHQTPKGTPFFTLYGHLDPECVTRLSVGDTVQKGDPFCHLGTPGQNGGWAPHVHFQLALTTEGMGNDWPGVANPDDMDLWGAICPNPSALLNLPDVKTAYVPIDTHSILNDRQTHFGANVKLSYADPVMFLRGWKHYLFDEWGRPHLDAYNNVPHVGHAHPAIQKVAADQLKRMNSNTRYLHPAQTDLAKKLLSKFPSDLSVCYFVNSGSEANELALRLARAHTGGRDIITMDHGYHGNTTGAIDISAYKFNAPGGIGKPDWVHLVDVADDYRGTHGRDDPDRGRKFATQIYDALDAVAANNGALAGWICETFPSVGGQHIPPPGYLSAVYEKIRAAGGVCIADEVQTGLGRLGEYYFAFEQQEVTPDIVVLGKPIGNGHPIGAVITSVKIAASFAKGPEFFSTFGGSTLSCRTALKVLDIVDDENLAQNAKTTGDYFLLGLRDLQTKHNLIGDVRGLGLFVGVELVTDRATLAPATEHASYVANRLAQNRILIGTEGPENNILKIRPPLTIQPADVDQIIQTLDQILSETALQFT